MSDILLYTKSWCPYCNRAKALLGKKGVDYTNIDIEEQPGKRKEMIDRAGGKTTVPQIFINGKHIGGCDDLYALEKAGKLDALLK